MVNSIGIGQESKNLPEIRELSEFSGIQELRVTLALLLYALYADKCRKEDAITEAIQLEVIQLLS
jgi:hypothetical protein